MNAWYVCVRKTNKRTKTKKKTKKKKNACRLDLISQVPVIIKGPESC